VDRGLRILEVAQDPSRWGDERFAGAGQACAVFDPVKELDAQLEFEALDGLAERGLRDVEDGGSGGERAVVGDREKVFERAAIDRPSLSPWALDGRSVYRPRLWQTQATRL
jgi:hypothetical protein